MMIMIKQSKKRETKKNYKKIKASHQQPKKKKIVEKKLKQKGIIDYINS